MLSYVTIETVNWLASVSVSVSIPDTLIGSEITLVTGNDVDSSPALSYSLQLDPMAFGKFGIHRFSGGVSLTAPLDFEEKTWYTVTVRATDSQHQTEANITILVEDINDNAPVFTQDLYQVGPSSRCYLGTGLVFHLSGWTVAWLNVSHKDSRFGLCFEFCIFFFSFTWLILWWI